MIIIGKFAVFHHSEKRIDFLVKNEFVHSFKSPILKISFKSLV